MFFTLDIATQHYPIITSVEGLPHDCFSLLPCPVTLGGVAILTSNSIIYIDRASRRVVLPVNGWPSRISDLPMLPQAPEDRTRILHLEGSRSAFVDEKTVFIVLKDGTIYPVEIIADGQSVPKLTMAPALAQTTIPTVVKKITDQHLFVGSTVGPSVLLKTIRVEEEVEEDQEMELAPAVVEVNNDIDMNDDDEGQFLRH